jgi:hypothetical protein
MSPAFIGQWGGFALLLSCVFWSNVAVFKMTKVLNSERAGLGIIHWQVKDDHSSRKVLRLYREKHSDGPLYRDFKVALLLAGIGGALFVAADFCFIANGLARR